MVAAPSASLPSDCRLRIIRSEQDFHALAPHWDALLARSATRTPFLSWDWVRLWWKHYGSPLGYSLAIGVIDEPSTGEPLAIAPFMLGREKEGPRRHLRHLTFLGSLGEEASQGMDLIVPREDEAALVPILCQLFEETANQWDVLHLPSLHGESPHLSAYRAVLSQHSEPGERMAAQPCYLMTLPDSWDELVETHWRSKERVIYRTKWRKMHEQHAGRALRGGLEVPWQQAFDELWRLHGLRFEGRDSTFLLDRTHAFHRELIDLWAPQGRVLLPLLELDGKVAAARYGFAYEGKYWSYQAGYDPSYGQLSVGKLSLGWTTQCAIEHGLREIDHLPGEASYKAEWSTHQRQVLHLEAFARWSPRALMFRSLRHFKRSRDQAALAAATAVANTTPDPVA